MKKVLCIGQVAYDITLVVDEYPEENKKMRAKRVVESPGGSAMNCAYLLASWGIDTTFAGTIGKDYMGDKIKKEISKTKINANFNEGEFTTTSYIIANVENGTRTIITNKNNVDKYSLFNTCEEYDMLVLDSNEVELSLKMLEKYKSAISILDAGKMCDEVLTLGDKVTYFVCSRDFAEKFTNIQLKEENDYINAYEKIVDTFKNQVIITLEDKGSFTKYENNYIIVPTISVKAVDSTGAGDIYHGALAYFILNSYKLDKAMYLANIAGALSTLKIGSKDSMPQLDSVLEEGMEII